MDTINDTPHMEAKLLHKSTKTWMGVGWGWMGGKAVIRFVFHAARSAIFEKPLHNPRQRCSTLNDLYDVEFAVEK